MENINSKSYEQGCLIKQADLMCINDHKAAFEESKAVRIFIKLTDNYTNIDLRKDWNAIFNRSFT